MTDSSVALDSNLLLLYIVGCASRDYIAKHKRLKAYSTEDFESLIKELSAASSVKVTPNTLTETSNLIDHIAEPARGLIYETFESFLALPESDEQYVPSKHAAAAPELPRLGLTDCVLLRLCADGVPLLTADLPLYLAAVARGAAATNFNHLRDAR